MEVKSFKHTARRADGCAASTSQLLKWNYSPLNSLWLVQSRLNSRFINYFEFPIIAKSTTSALFCSLSTTTMLASSCLSVLEQSGTVQMFSQPLSWTVCTLGPVWTVDGSGDLIHPMDYPLLSAA